MNGIKHINMDYEKAYKEALEQAKKELAVCDNMDCDAARLIFRLFPQLRENEDERIRKELIAILKKSYNVGGFTLNNKKDLDEYLAYLEKRKEQIPYTDFVIKSHKGDDTNPYDMSASEAHEYVIKRGFGIPFIDGEVYVDERHITQTIGNILRWADEHPKEQKPVERSLEDDHIIGFVYDLLNEIEWKDNWAMSKDECLQRLNNYSPQKHVELSEEDRNNFNRISAILVEGAYVQNWWSRERLISKDEMEKLTNWLKSLRPSWKPSEEQMNALEEVRAIFHHHHLWDEINPILYDYEELMRDLQKLL